MSSLLEINEVSQSFRTGFWLKKAEVLKDVSFSLQAHSVSGFLGANGAGKTTLIQLIVGLRKPTLGSVQIAGLEAHTPEARSRIGYLPERPYFHDHLTGEGMLSYFGALSGMSRPLVRDRIGKVLAAVGMSDARKVELKRYSKGMLQRIGIAQAILHDPEFLVLDEPMSGLDPLGRKEIRELIIGLASEGRTIFFSSHVIADVEAICGQVAVIKKGKLLGCGPIGQLLSQGPMKTEIGFSGVNAELARQIPAISEIREIPEGMRATIDGESQINEVVRRILDENGQVLWVTPIRPSLEELFTR